MERACSSVLLSVVCFKRNASNLSTSPVIYSTAVVLVLDPTFAESLAERAY